MIAWFRRTRLMVLFLLAALAVGSAGCLNISGNQISVGDIEGTVNITSNPPQAKILINGVETKYITPSTMTLPAKKTNISLVRDGYYIWSSDVSIPFGETVTVSGDMEFNPATFTINLNDAPGIGYITVTADVVSCDKVAKVTYYVTNAGKTTEAAKVLGAPYTYVLDLSAYTGYVALTAEAEDVFGNKASAPEPIIGVGTKPAEAPAS